MEKKGRRNSGGGKLTVTSKVAAATIIVCEEERSDRKICGVESKGPQSHGKHLKLHQPIKCPDCPKGVKFPDYWALEAHKKEAHQQQFQCRKDWCSLIFDDKNKRRHHEERCKPSAEKIKCAIERCFCEFSHVPDYKRHLLFAHRTDDTETEELLARARKEVGLPEVPTASTSKKKTPAAPESESDEATSSPLQDGDVFGAPVGGQILKRGAFTVHYEYKRRGPRCVFESLTKEYLQKPATTPRARYVIDTEVDEWFRSGDEDFQGTVYNRGHMAAARCHISDEKTFLQTSLYSNILPQLPAFNQGIWNTLEAHQRTFAEQCVILYAYTGGAYDDEVKRKCGRIPVPSHFYKVLLGKRADTKEWELQCFLIPHQESSNGKPYMEFRKELETIEAKAGMRFFPNFQRRLIAVVNGKKKIHLLPQ